MVWRMANGRRICDIYAQMNMTIRCQTLQLFAKYEVRMLLNDT